MYPPNFKTSILFSVAVFFASNAAALSAPVRKAIPKSSHTAQQNTQVLKSPNGQYSVMLRVPKSIGEGEKAWGKLAIKYKDGKITNVESDEYAYQPAESINDLWSPDGKYALFYVYSSSGNTTDHTYLDLENATWAVFQTEDGTSPTLDNDNGWIKDKPHSLKVLQMDKHGKTTFLEASPQ